MRPTRPSAWSGPSTPSGTRTRSRAAAVKVAARAGVIGRAAGRARARAPAAVGAGARAGAGAGAAAGAAAGVGAGARAGARVVVRAGARAGVRVGVGARVGARAEAGAEAGAAVEAAGVGVRVQGLRASLALALIVTRHKVVIRGFFIQFFIIGLFMLDSVHIFPFQDYCSFILTFMGLNRTVNETLLLPFIYNKNWAVKTCFSH